MKWYEAYDILQCGGNIRLKSWEEHTYIYLAEVQKDEESNTIVDELGTEVTLSESELCSKEWEEYIKPDDRGVQDLEYNDLLLRTKALCSSRLLWHTKQLNLFLLLIAERNNAVPDWEEENGIKYFIVYSHNAKRYRLDTAWKECIPGVTYFSNEETAKIAMERLNRQYESVRILNSAHSELVNSYVSKEDLILLMENIKKMK